MNACKESQEVVDGVTIFRHTRPPCPHGRVAEAEWRVPAAVDLSKMTARDFEFLRIAAHRIPCEDDHPELLERVGVEVDG